MFGIPTPPRRARCIECASIVPCLPLRSAGRSPFKVVVKPRFSASHNQRTSREIGGDAGGLRRPKPNAAVRCQTSLPRICRARFSASGGRRPLHWDIAPAGRGGAQAPRRWKIALSCGWDDTAHNQPLSRRELRLARPTLRFGYSRAIRDSTRMQRGRPKRARESCPAWGDSWGHNHGR